MEMAMPFGGGIDLFGIGNFENNRGEDDFNPENDGVIEDDPFTTEEEMSRGRDEEEDGDDIYDTEDDYSDGNFE